MTPTFFTTFAQRLFPNRRWLLAASLCGITLLAASLWAGPPELAFLASLLAGPLIAVPWALLCACTWFHPQRGNLQSQSKFVGRLPRTIQQGLRWYAALFLGLFIFAGCIVLPILSIAWLP